MRGRLVAGCLLCAAAFGLSSHCAAQTAELLRPLSEATFTLPGGKTLRVPKGTLCEKLAAFMESGSEFDMPTFAFDDLTFGPGSTKIQPGSEAELQALGEILLAYPEIRFTIRGQTDASGDADMNKELSLRRAESVKDALIERSVAESRIRVRGFGPDDPLEPNALVHGRQKNRRTELQVTYR